ncbi:hypothetical protein BDF21DRAFT_492713 [Thamnidium elegans]|nr:hypothetical protein BDF21DRAFT_492713 [Thamnidium elegans]
MSSIANEIEQTLAMKEHLAEEILINKQAIADFEKKIQTNAKALQHVEKGLEKKSWTFFGDMFIKLPTKKTQELIENEQDLLEEKIEISKQVIQKDRLRLQQLESKKDLHGFNLTGMTATDMYNNNK